MGMAGRDEPGYRYDERLGVPRLWHLWAAGFAAIAGSYAAAYVDGLAAEAAIYLAVFAVLEAGLRAGGRARIAVTGDGTLLAAGARVAVDDVADVEVLDDVRAALVPGTAAATRGWVRRGVLVRTRAAQDVVLSSRHPDRVAAALGHPAGQPSRQARPS